MSPKPTGAEPEQIKVSAQLATALRKRLPDYMVPAEFVFLDRFPTTPTGKVDRAALPAPEATRAHTESYVAPRTDVEREVCGVAERLLEMDRVGMRDDFFALGGHSLLAARLVTELRRIFEVELLLEELFLTPTIEGLAAAIEKELARKRHLNDHAARMERLVAEMPDNAVDALLQQLVTRQAAR